MAIDRAMDTWQAQYAMRKVDLVKRADAGADPDIFDSFFGFGAAAIRSSPTSSTRAGSRVPSSKRSVDPVAEGEFSRFPSRSSSRNR